MHSEISVIKPEPILVSKSMLTFNQGTDVVPTIKSLEKGEFVLIHAFYNDGIFLLKQIHRYLGQKLQNSTKEEQRIYRSEFQKLSNLILIEVKNQKLNVKKAPDVGWLQKFYDESSFYLPFPQIQGMNSSWQWFKNGISIPVLRNKLHPYYGVYFPTRFEHLMVFDNWLKRYDGPKKSAIEVGIGSGVLAMQMVQHGFQKVFATDVNPNAIIGLKEYMGTTKLSRKIELDCGNLFGKWEKPSELIVFNPPWLPETYDSEGLDQAMYYDRNLFPQFFEEAEKRLLPDGKLILLFSNLAQITNVSNEHPIEKELAENNRFKLERCFKKSVGKASEKTKRDANWREDEQVELWELSLI